MGDIHRRKKSNSQQVQITQGDNIMNILKQFFRWIKYMFTGHKVPTTTVYQKTMPKLYLRQKRPKTQRSHCFSGQFTPLRRFGIKQRYWFKHKVQI